MSIIHFFMILLVIAFLNLLSVHTTIIHQKSHQHTATASLKSFNYTYFAKNNYNSVESSNELSVQIEKDEDNNTCEKQTTPCSIQTLFRVAAQQVNQDVKKNLDFNQLALFNINIVLMNNFTANNSNCELAFNIDSYRENDILIFLNFQSITSENRMNYACIKQAALIETPCSIGLENVEMQNVNAPFYKIQNSIVRKTMMNPISTLTISNSIVSDGLLLPPFSFRIENSQLINSKLSIDTVDVVEIVNSTIIGTIETSELNNVQLFKISNVQFYLGISWKMILRSIQDFIFIDSVVRYLDHSSSSDLIIFDLDTIFKVTLKGLRFQDIGATAFNIQYSSYVSLENLEILSNRCMGVTKPLIRIRHASSVNLLNNYFKDNSCSAISIENARSLSCTSSTFINNGRQSSGGAIYGSDINILSIENSTFIGNKAIGSSGGGAYFLNIGAGSISKCHWENNIASIQGGGLFYSHSLTITSGLVITESTFIGNSLDSPSNSTISKNFLDCKGVGGSFSVSNLNVLESSIIRGNRATWGGGGFYFSNNLNVGDTILTDNIASFAGGALFSTSNLAPNFLNYTIMKNNQALVYGDNYATPINTVLDFELILFDIDGQVSNTLRKPETIQVFYGQRIAFNFLHMVDKMGNEFRIMQEKISIYDFFYDFDTVKYDYPNGIECEIRKHNNDNLINKNYTLSLSLIRGFLHVNLQFVDCPSGYELGEKVCVKSFPTALVASLSTVGLLFALLVGGIIGFLFSKIAKKISYMRERVSTLTKREQADDDIERKLLENPFQSYGEEINTTRDSFSLSADFSITNTPRTKLKKISKFIINSEDLTFTKKVAEGGFGSIYLAKWNSSTDVAVKSFHQNLENTDEEEFEKEVALLVNLRNPHIVSFYGICITESKKFMVVEYMDKGSLDRIVYESKCGRETISFKQKLRILIDVASGMKYLHSLNPAIIHRDLKPANILINSSGTAKVCDFGLSKTVNNGSRHSLYTATVGTLYYIAPEMINSDMKKHSTLLHKIDVYSFAIVAWELFFEENPFLNEESRKIHYFNPPKESEIVNAFSIIFKVSNNGLRPKIPFNNRIELSEWMNTFMRDSDKNYFTTDGPNEKLVKSVEFYIELMKQSWDQEPSNRPNFAQILSQLLTINELL